MTWHVLSNEIGTILAVYGSALVNIARKRGADIAKESGCKVALHTVQTLKNNRPHVYGTISMLGNLEWL